MDLEGYEALRSTGAWVELDSYGILRLRGADALNWLHGQTTQSLADLPLGEYREAALCSVTGQIRALIEAFCAEHGVLVTGQKECLEVVRTVAEETIFMEEVEIEPLDLQPLLVTGSSSLIPPEATSGAVPTSLLKGACVLWTSHDDPIRKRVVEGLPAASPEAFDCLRIEQGTPLWGRDATPKTLPPELGPSFMARYVSDRKGCYIGQEVIVRIRSRGHVNRVWRALELESPVSPGDLVHSAIRPESGVVTSSAESPTFGPIAGAMMRKEAADPGTTIEVDTAKGLVRGTVREMPLSDGS